MTDRTQPHASPRFSLRTLIAILIMLAGLSLLLYPIVSQSISALDEASTVAHYDDAAAKLGHEQREKVLQAARDYNYRLSVGKTPIPSLYDEHYQNDREYMSQLSVKGSADALSVIATLEIPKISVNLAIRRGTTVQTLSSGAGHLYGTSLPVGGKGSNSVIAGHRGLPNALIFTRLDELKKGDYLFIHGLGEKLSYRVDKMWVVGPEDTTHLGITPGKDYVTLLTCTPYGVNSHRLLVRAERVSDSAARVQSDDGIYPSWVYAGLVAAAVMIVGCGIAARRSRVRYSRRSVAAHSAQ